MKDVTYLLRTLTNVILFTLIFFWIVRRPGTRCGHSNTLSGITSHITAARGKSWLSIGENVFWGFYTAYIHGPHTYGYLNGQRIIIVRKSFSFHTVKLLFSWKSGANTHLRMADLPISCTSVNSEKHNGRHVIYICSIIRLRIRSRITDELGKDTHRLNEKRSNFVDFHWT